MAVNSPFYTPDSKFYFSKRNNWKMKKPKSLKIKTKKQEYLKRRKKEKEQKNYEIKLGELYLHLGELCNSLLLLHHPNYNLQ